MSADHPPVYGLDIETDTAAGGLDPGRAAVIAAAIVAADDEVVLGGPEPELLAALDATLAALDPGVIVTWNGAAFDLPFLSDRAGHHGLALGVELVADPGLVTRTPLPGHAGSYRATWFGHRHLDAYRLYRNDLKRVLDVSCSLKSVADLVGLPHVRVDPSCVHELTPDELRRYVVSDARLARELALRRWSTAAAFVDRRVPGAHRGADVA